MTIEHQKEIVALLAEIMALSPADIRLGQFFGFMGDLAEMQYGQSIGYIEDEELLSVIRDHAEALRRRAEAIGDSPLSSAPLATIGVRPLSGVVSN